MEEYEWLCPHCGCWHYVREIGGEVYCGIDDVIVKWDDVIDVRLLCETE